MKKNALFVIVLTSALSAFVASAVFNIYGKKNESQPVVVPKTVPVSTAQMVAGNNMLPDFINAAEISVHAVVHVKIRQRGYNYTYDNLFYEFFFGEKPNYQQRENVIPSGSGVIVSSDGYIVTNNHVIESADEVEVTLNDKRNFKAKIIGTDRSTDIALLKIDEKDLPFLSFGNSDNIQIGQWVLAVGNPFNLTSTVTAGIISAKARNISILSDQFAIESFIQTDAVVNPGNSGGALVNTNGELIGINTAIASPTGSYTGYSFAIPSNIAQKIVRDIIEFGEVQRAYLGVSIMDINAENAKEYKISRLNGVYVNGINEVGAARDAGIEKGDIIIKVENISVSNVSELQEQLSKYRPGDQIYITIERDKSEKSLLVKLLNKNGTAAIVKTEKTGQIMGATFSPVPNELKNNLRIKNGVQIVELKDGKFYRAGVRQGFIVVYINRERVNSVEDIQYVLQRSSGGVFIEGIYPNGTTAYYAFGI